MTTTARDRAEELVHNLQKRAKDMLEAEDGLVSTVRQLVEEKGFSPADVKKRLDDVMGRIKANTVWERVRTSDTANTLSDYRDELERRVDDSVKRLFSTLPIVSKADLAKVEEEVVGLRKKFDTLRKKVKVGQPEA